jgi:uronate dehydrogenase
MPQTPIILITGASGNIGSKISKHLLEKQHRVRLIDRVDRVGERVHLGDLSQWNSHWVEKFRGVHTVIHLAANPDDTASWEDLIATNCDAAIYTFQAALRAGVKRIIFASSNHVMGGYKDLKFDLPLSTLLPARPGTHYVDGGRNVDSTPYGAMKLFIERFGKCLTETHGIEFISLRLGWIQKGDNLIEDLPKNADDWFKSMWLSNNDLCNLFERAVDAKLYDKFVVLNGMSENDDMNWNIEATKRILGYAPQDGIKLTSA